MAASQQPKLNPGDLTEESPQFYDAEGSHQANGAPILTPEERVQMQEDLRKTEDEINTLRQVLSARIKHAADLKRKLGITPWRELQEDVSQGLRNVKESDAYQRTGEIMHQVGDKTTQAWSSMTNKLGQLRNMQAFKSFETGVGSAYTTVKAKIAASTSIDQLSGHARPGNPSSPNGDNN